MLRVTTVDQLTELAGAALGPSRPILVTQQMIDVFADTTQDRQWIHVDPDRAAQGPYGTTIAHGYLTLALLAPFVDDLLKIDVATALVNYGLDRVRFPSAVPTGSTLYATGTVDAVDPITGGQQIRATIVVHRQDFDKPACVAQSLVRVLL